MGIDIEHLNALRVGTNLVVEVAPSSAERRAWVSIYPLKEDSDRQANAERWKLEITDRQFNVHRQEFSKTHIESDLEMSERYGMWTIASESVNGEQALFSLLREWGAALDKLEYPWATDFPL